MKFDIEALRVAAGDKVFARGQSYHENGAIEVIGADDTGILARAYGSDVYAVELNWQVRGFSGTCTCPAFEDWGVCKHLVAVALTVNESDDAAIEDARRRLIAIRERLLGMSSEALVRVILLAAARDDQLLDALEIDARRGDPLGSD